MFSLALLFNHVSKDTYLIKGGEMLEFNHVSILRIKSPQVSNYSLFFWLLNITFNHEFLKLTCVFFNIEAAMSKIMELKITILDVGGWEKPWLKLSFHLIPLILLFLHLTLLAQRLVHHKEAHFLSLRATNFTFLSSGMSLYSKTLSTVCIHSRNSSGSNLLSYSRILTLNSLELV